MIEQCKYCKNKKIVNGIFGCIYMDADCQNGEKYEAEIITNADRIRAMSDEELADWLARTQIDNVAEALEIAKIPYEQEDGLKDEVKKECLEWLRQPTA